MAVNNWKDLGLQLKVAWWRLQAIEKEYKTTSDCRTQMLIEWQKLVTPTWSAVVQALFGIHHIRLALELAQKKGQLNVWNLATLSR